MKKWKWILIEAVVLVALIVAACVIGVNMDQKPTPTEPAAAALSQTETTAPAPTEPPPEPVVATWAIMPEDYFLNCREFFVYDVTKDEFLSVSGDPAQTQVYPASITKLFTIHVAMQYLEPDTPVTVGAEITLIDPDSTVAQLQQGDVLPAEQVVAGMLLPSGNDAAYVLAAAAGRVIQNDPDCSALIAVNAFVEEMNRQAQALGMTGSHFRNPDGIHEEDHYLTLKDLALVGKLSLEDPLVMAHTDNATETVQIADRSVTWSNTNALVRSDYLERTEPLDQDPEDGIEEENYVQSLSELYCQYAIGLKTGRTSAAGGCLLSAFQVQGRQLVIGVFGCPDGLYRFTDTLHLLNETLGVVKAEA